MASVTFDHVTKRFGNVIAVDDLTLEVADKEFLVLVGPSGCGKTTALRLLAGLEELTSGTISIDGRPVNNVAPKDRDIAMVFQSYALYPHMSVFDNLAFCLKLDKRPRAEIVQRAQKTADILGIGELLKRKPKQLSGGQRQRVALGRAIIREPRVFLMDEPLSNLDAKLRAQTRAEIAKLHQQLQATFIYVTHDQMEAMALGTRIAVMKDGKIQQLDTPQTIYNHPANMFVAGFIGSPAMNFFPASFLRGEAILGIRPEDIYTERQVPQEIVARNVPATVDVVELMGSEMYLHLIADEGPLIACVAPQAIPDVGEKITMIFNMGKAHFFDPVNGEAI
jgi:multiple sugar transport system ATP-binding protein